ncbi:MAG: hypothetical protein FD181_2686 [Prolixibacteraceae bacterium]|nr:MAG: hypothetical protein FD181_2686 [Prolixibacteraceae bacterium]
MRLKLLLFTMLLSMGIFAQEAYRGLVITESRMSATPDNYVEITNMGDKAVNLKDFELGKVTPWSTAINDVFNDPFTPGTFEQMRLPDFVLEPGKSFVVATAYDFADEQYRKKIAGFEGGQQRLQKLQIYEIADLLLHMSEVNGDATDSITRNAAGEIFGVLEAWGGREALYLEHHLSEVDSVVIDQVGGVFDNNGQNFDRSYDVAGVTGATNNSILIRKSIVKQGNLDFANARGVGEDDSEWIVWQRPANWEQWRDLQWTVGNHGDYVLDEKTLESDIVDVNFAGKTITVPWGIRRGDGVMRAMKQKPAVRWIYDLGPNFKDSLTFAARTGDKLHITVTGNKAHKATFNIIVAEPTAGANIVVPVTGLNYPTATAVQWWRGDNQRGMLDWPRVTQHKSGTDSITGNWYGIPYATRVDSLLMRLEKAANAKWEIVPVDGVARPDLKHGDKLKVIAQNGAVKEYFIEVRPLQPSHNAYLASITWPDIPDAYRGLFGWVGDTVPGFNATTYNYRITVPMDVDGIPALVAKTQQLNAKVQVNRATSLYGTIAQRTIQFVVTAEDDSVSYTYNVELVKEIDPSKLQPYHAEPFLSEFIFWEQWSNGFAEIANPGNQPLDLSNYMFTCQWNTNPSGAITARMLPTEWLDRYDKYVPGYKWVNEAQWSVTPGILQQDLNVNALVMPGDVFCLGAIFTDGVTNPSWIPTYRWPVPAQLDVQFNMYPNNSNKRDFPNGHVNPWGERISGNGSPIRKWSNSSWFMFKILNDSIKQGLKPANNPADFELIETWSMASTTDWIVGGKRAEMITNWIRKPHIYKSNTGFGTNGSFGTNPETSEWTFTDRPYWQKLGIGWPQDILNVGNDIGQHFMHEPTQYKSTVSSIVYKVSEGYSMNESIRGLKTGTTVADFMGGITKAHEKQALKVKRAAAELAMGDAVKLNDVLEVMSADSVNTTKYVLNVTNEGLSSNAVLTSTRYTVTIEQQPKSASAASAVAGVGNIKGFEYGTALRTVLANITVPFGASLTVIDGHGAYIPLKMLNFDTTYINVTVNNNIFLNVVAENGVTQINYQLIPSSSDNDAFLLSDVYSVIQKDLLVQYVPRGTNVSTFLSNLVPSGKATMKLVNKMGQVRLDGGVADDDKVVVTSANGKVTKTYHISKLASEATPATTYLAYILSSVYGVDQVAYKVAGVSGTETIAAFLGKVTAAPGATAMVVNKNGAMKTSGDIDGSDMVKVTSADGKINVIYTFGPLTSADVLKANDIQLYPNPTNGEINVSGLKAGYRIQVYNSVGAAVRDINVQSSVEIISLRNQPAGMYMIVVSDNSKLLGRYKALKQ